MEPPSRRQYKIEELVYLRNSPLAQKPVGLPPIEEWMGTAPTTRPQTTRARTDGDEDGSKCGMSSNRRPSLFETRHLPRSSFAEDIILGPPKVTFSSSSARTSSGKFDHDSQTTSLASPVLDDDRGESPRFERFRVGGNPRLGKDMDKDRPERNSIRGDHTKRGFGRDDTEGWTSVASRQPRKSFGAEDGDRFRGSGDRGKRETPWDKDRSAKYDNFGREREHRSRGRRDEASWLLDDRGADRGERDHHRDRDYQRYNNNNTRSEKDPEWMDSGPCSEDRAGDIKAVHSMEEFQRWKERMKASNAPEEKKNKAEALAEPVELDGSPTEPKGGRQSPREAENAHSHFGELATAPVVVENGVDRFFGLWGAPGVSKSLEQDALSNARPETKAAVKSRFTSLFAPQEPASPVTPDPPIAAKVPTPANESSSEDKEGFQRILKILSGVHIGGADAVSVPSSVMSRPPQPSVSPLALMMSSHPPPPHPQQGPVTSAAPHRDADADFLLRLMHQSHQSQQGRAQGPPPPPPLHTSYGGPSQMPPPPPISTSPHSFQRSKNNPLSPAFDDPAITAFRQRSNRESTSPINIIPRGPPLIEQHSLPGGWNPQQQQQQQQQQQPPPSQSHRPVPPPPGFSRQQSQHQQHHPGPPPPFIGPPPGVNGPPSMPFPLGPPPINMPPNFGPPPPFFGLNNINSMNGHPPPPPPPQMNGPPPPGYHMPFHHPHGEPHGPPMGMHGPPFGFPHDALKHPQHPHGHGNPRFPNEPLHRQLR